MKKRKFVDYFNPSNWFLISYTFHLRVVYRACLKDYYPQTRFFFSWGICTILYLFCAYEYHVVGFINLPKIISPNENTCLIILSVLGKKLCWKFENDPKARSVKALASSHLPRWALLESGTLVFIYLIISICGFSQGGIQICGPCIPMG